MHVDYNLENMLKCEVQTHNKCTRIEQEGFKKIEAKGLEAIPVFKPKEFQWLYCSTGKAECHDLSFKEKCKYKECKVWMENNLKKQIYQNIII